MEFIVTAHPEHFHTVEEAQQHAANLVEATGQTLYVLPVEGRVPGFKLDYVGVVSSLEEGEEPEETEQEWQARFARALVNDIKHNGVPKPRAVRLYRDAFRVDLASAILAIDIAIGELNGGEND